MRNKKPVKYAIVLGLALPMLVFSVVFAEDNAGIADDNSENPVETKQTQTGDDLTAEKQKRLEELRRQEANKKTQERADLIEQARQEAAGETKENDGERTRVERIRRMGALMNTQVQRAEGIVTRLERIIAKVESRRDRMQESGGFDLTEVDAALNKAKAELTQAQAALSEAQASFASLSDSDAPKQSAQAFVAAMKELKTEVMATHSALKDTVLALRQALADAGPETN